MGNTPIYGFGYIEPNQDLSENIDLDELRFRAIENQMYNLYQIFKNGIIESDPNTPSWRIQTYANDFKFTKISVTSGQGFVSYKAARTTSPKDISLPIIPANSSTTRIFVLLNNSLEAQSKLRYSIPSISICNIKFFCFPKSLYIWSRVMVFSSSSTPKYLEIKTDSGGN